MEVYSKKIKKYYFKQCEKRGQKFVQALDQNTTVTEPTKKNTRTFSHNLSTNTSTANIV
jgi:hypothetical protein